MPAAQCDTRELSIGEADRIGSQQSVGFANFVETIGERTSGQLSIAVGTLANTQPVLAYPEATIATAGQWNAVAAANQRIEIRLDAITDEP